MGDVARYSVPTSTNPDAPQTPEQARIASEQARTPGVVRVTGDRVEIEENTQVQKRSSYAAILRDPAAFATDTNGRSVDLHSTKLDAKNIMVPDEQGQPISLEVARYAGLWKRDANGRWVPTFTPVGKTEPQPQGERTEEQQPTPEQEQQDNIKPEDRAQLPERTLENVKHVSDVMGLETVLSVGAQLSEGRDLTTSRIESVAQSMGVEPEQAKAIIGRTAESYFEVGRRIAADAGVDGNELVAWASKERTGKYRDAVSDLITKNDTRGLRALAKEYASSSQRAASFTESDLREATLGEGVETFDQNGRLMIRLAGGEAMPLLSAIRAGYVKVSG